MARVGSVDGRRHRRWMGTAFALCATAMLAFGAAAGEEPPAAIEIGEWLVLGPVPGPLPAFHGERPGGFALKDLLGARQYPDPFPRPHLGDEVRWTSDTDLGWRRAEPGTDGSVDLGGTTGPQVAYLAAYLRVSRFTEIDLVARSHHLIRLDVDGIEVAKKDGSTPAADGEEETSKRRKRADGEDEPEAAEAKGHLELEPGVHRIFLKAVRDPDCAHPWTVAAELTPEGGADLEITISPEHPLELAQVLEAPRPRSIATAPDGTLVAVTLARIAPGTDDAESWVEIRRVGDGGLERTYRGARMSGVRWAPRGRRLSYVTRVDGKATLWLADLATGETVPLLERVERFGSYRWAPDGSSVIYSVSFEPDEEKGGMRRLQGLQDRQAGWRTKSYLFQVAVPDGARRRLTAGELTTRIGDISPDGRRLLFLRTWNDYENRPYLRHELYTLDLETLAPTLLYPGHFLSGASWSPDGSRVLIVAGPSAFDGAGSAVPEGTIPNDYDEQIYLMDPASGEVEPLSREFDPSVGQVVWHRGDGKIYLTATTGSRRLLYRLDPDARSYTPLDTGIEVIDDLDVADRAPVAALTGSSAAAPPRVVALGLDGAGARVLDVPGAAGFADVKLGDVKPWSFTSRRGIDLEGRVYYPPDFDPERTYPAIIYYYGGTSPVTRDFGGRYPKNWWAAHGYVVYVLQPSGATGYGQAFSALHVNDWGRIAGADILEGVEKFLAAHPFVDPERLGCIGASYGGFMTQYLLTRTERFAAGISHAGISLLGSYWGEGYWGYAYSAVATADSFPWNRGDVYVGHSPLSNADRIRTPLLLLHGSVDTNVPPGESDQLYTALKLLGREVEYIQVEGQNHHILKHDQRVLWGKTIVAWFDRWLKEEPAWWEHLYPDPGADAKE